MGKEEMMAKYRSKFEASVAKVIPKGFEYETTKFTYELTHTYLPDWIDPSRQIMIETKGLFSSKDRTKALAIKKLYADWRLIFVFQNPNKMLSKKSKTTYHMWALAHGFESMDVYQIATLKH